MHGHNRENYKPSVAPMEVSVEAGNADAAEWLDDDGRPRRTGTVWTASAHIITAVIGSGVLSLAWAIAQLGWVAGPAAIPFFAFVTYHTAMRLTEGYRNGDQEMSNRNYTYMDIVSSTLGRAKVAFCGVIQYANLVGVAIGYTIASSISMRARRAGCFHTHGHADLCKSSSTPYMILFGAVQILFSQIPDFNQIWWLSIVAEVMSFTYSSIGIGLGIAQTIPNGGFKGSLTGISIGADVTPTQKFWHLLQALGDIAFAYSFSNILIEIQDTIKAPPPSESTVIKRATVFSVAVTTLFYMLFGCMGYAAFGGNAPENLLTGFEPFWLLDVAIVVHHVGAYQVYCQPIFAFVERRANEAWPDSAFITREVRIGPFAFSVFRLTWRTAFVCLTTAVAMLPFIDNVMRLLSAVSFWPLNVYIPIEMYIKLRGVPHGSTKWILLRTLSICLFLVSIVAVYVSMADLIDAIKVYPPSSG